MLKSWLGIGSAIVVAMLASGVVHAATSAGSGYWTNSATWSGGTVPANGDDVVIASGHSVTVDVATASLNSLTNNGTLTFAGWPSTVLTATVVQVNGTITHKANAATASPWTPDNRIYIVCSNLTVAATKTIDASGKGYLHPASGVAGYGPGGGTSGRSGGSYGGTGGGSSGSTYGSVTNPVDPGSTGCGTGGDVGGDGGGGIRIEASGQVAVNGTIAADGTRGVNGGGGAGGSVFISCRTITSAGGGRISAAGAATGQSLPTSNGAGGGGRIAAIYDTAAQGAVGAPPIVFSVQPGLYSSGDIGTLYFPDNSFLTGVIPHSGQWMVSGVTNWAPNTLTLTNGWLRFPASGFSLAVTNGIAVYGTNVGINRLQLYDASVTCGSDALFNGAGLHLLSTGGATSSVFQSGGNLVFTNSAELYVYAGQTNGVAPVCGAFVGAAGELYLGTNCWVYPYAHNTNGGAVCFAVSNLTVAATNSGFNADAKGYRAAATGVRGFGPGGAPGGYNGGGYGGVGGANGGSTYGSAAAPAAPGSAGAGSSGDLGGAGGGAIWIQVTNRAVVNGVLSANGGTAGGGGGSGGGIYIACRSFAASGAVLRASGGAGNHAADGGGGGGRIAVVYDPVAENGEALPALSLSTMPGSGSFGDVGTLYFADNRLITEPFLYSGQWMVTNFTSWAPGSLTVSNGWLRLPYVGFNLAVTNGLSVIGTNPSLHMLQLYDAALSCGAAASLNSAALHLLSSGGTNAVTFRCGGNLAMTNGALLYVYAGKTNALTSNAGADVNVSGDVTITTNCWVYPFSHNTNGGSARFTMNNLTLATPNCGINADGKGYRIVPLVSGKGNGPGGAAAGSNGGGYGGAGGGSGGGGTYGSSNAPVDAGSSGSGTAGDTGRAGGGLAWIRAAGNVTLNGQITANGGTDGSTGGGSGGGIYLTCRKLSGAGKFAANGSDTGPNASIVGGGGGGRIAIWRISMYDTFLGTATALPGAGKGGASLAATGTVLYGDVPIPRGTVLIFR